MRVLLDHNSSEHLVPLSPDTALETAKSRGWDAIRNGEPLRKAQEDGFHAMLTADQNIFYQQNNVRRGIALLVVNTNDLSVIIQKIEVIATALKRVQPGGFEILQLVPFHPKRRGPRLLQR